MSPESEAPGEAWHRSVALVCATAFLLMLGLSVLFPVLGYFTRDLGLTDFDTGLFMSSYALASFATAPLWGRFSERAGRKPAILIGLLGFSLAFGLFGLGSTFWELLGARVLGGVLAAAAQPAVFAYVADATPSDKRSIALGMVGAAFGLGVTIGPVFGGLIAEAYGYRAPFFAASALGLLAAVSVAFLLPESLTDEVRARNAERRRELSSRGLTFRAIAWSLAPFLLFSLLVQTGRMGLESTLVFLVDDRLGAGARSVGFLLGGVGIVSVLVQGGAIRPLSKRYSDRSLMLAGTALLALGLAGLAFAHSWTALVLTTVVLGGGSALLTPTFTAELSRAAEDTQGEAQGLNTSAQSLGRVIGPVLFTGLYQTTSTTAPYLVAAGLVALAFAIGWRGWTSAARQASSA